MPASDTLGGDWYDAFALGPGRIVVAVGDVVGHGLSAAAIMAQLRTALRAYAIDGHTPGEVVERVNRMMWQLGPTAMTTLAYIVVDPMSESLELVTAGHPPPLVITTDGEAGYLPLTGGVALGVTPTARYSAVTHPLPLGATVMLYTDGLVESRVQPIDTGLERLRVLARGADDPEALCEVVTAELVPERPADDIAMILARLTAVPEHLTGTWPADKEVLGDVRMVLRRWLRSRGASDDEAYDILVASPGGVRQRGRACVRPRHALVRARRPLRGRPRHRHGARPRALAAAARHEPRPRAADDGGADGARRGHAHGRGDRRGPGAHARQEGGMSWLARVVEELHDDVAVAAVEGEIDSSNVGEIAERIRAMLTNRSLALVVDLARTTYIDSAGINLLFTLGSELKARQQQMLLVVAPGSAIARMLSITGLDAAVPTHPTRDAALAEAT